MSVFVEFQLPSPATWLYWSLLLTVALFFQFQKLLSIRNLDLIALFLLVPGVLLVQFGGNTFTGYIWLFAASGFWLFRSILDGALLHRPTFRSNLNKPGLAFFGLALFAVLVAVAIRKPATAEPMIGRTPVVVTSIKDSTTAMASQTQPQADGGTVRVVVERTLSLTAHAAVALGLLLIGIRHFRDAETGAAMATLYLLFPVTGYHVAQLHHVLPAALVTWAIVLHRTPLASGFLLGLAGGTILFPVLLFPIWLRLYRGKGSGRFALAYFGALALGLGLTALVLWSIGLFPAGAVKALHLSDWQPWRAPQAEGFWQGVHWAYRLPVFIVYVAFILVLFVWPPVKTLAHATSLSAAVLIALQFWYADRGGMYVLWYLPLLIVMTLRPTTNEWEPLPLTGWASRWLKSRGRSDNPPVLAG